MTLSEVILASPFVMDLLVMQKQEPTGQSTMESTDNEITIRWPRVNASLGLESR